MKKKEVSPFDLALNYLSYRSRTEMEMEHYLEKKGLDDMVIADVITKLKYYQYIDDLKYVQVTVSQNAQGNQYGRQRLKADLIRRGIKSSDLNNLEHHYTEKMEEECLRAQFERACQRYQNEPVVKQKQKISAYLQRRGFSFDLIASAMATHQFSYEEENDDSNEGMNQLVHYFKKYDRMYRRKGFSERELENRIIRGLRSRGYSYELIQNVMLKHADEECGEETC